MDISSFLKNGNQATVTFGDQKFTFREPTYGEIQGMSPDHNLLPDLIISGNASDFQKILDQIPMSQIGAVYDEIRSDLGLKKKENPKTK